MFDRYHARTRRAARYLIVFLFGAVIYATIELLWRGRSHWTMALTGGAACSGIYFLEGRLQHLPLTVKSLLGGLYITLLELFVGCTVNLALGWQIWDYSHLPLNLFGQICPLYSLFWTLLSLPAFLLCAYLRQRLWERPNQH